MKIRYFGDSSPQLSIAPRLCRAVLACSIIVGAAVGPAAPAQADERVRAGEASSARELQRIELRRALLNNWEPGDSSRARPSLSDEERRARRRDLRDAVRGAYPDEVRAKPRR